MNELIQPSNIQPLELFEKFMRLETASGAAAPRTVKTYLYGIGIYMAWAAINSLDVKTATYEDMTKYRAYLIGRYGRSSIQLYLVALRAFYASLRRWGMRQDNPAEGLRAPKENQSKSSSVIEKSLTPDDARKLLAILPQLSFRNSSMVRLMVHHGLRAEEVAMLKARCLTGSGDILSVIGKGNRERQVILSEECRIALQELSRRCMAIESPLFQGNKNQEKHLSVMTVERIVNGAMILAGIKVKGKSAHSLRHTFAMLAVLGGASREALGEAMGHKQLSTTDVYVKAAAAYQDNPTDAVISMLNKMGDK